VQNRFVSNLWPDVCSFFCILSCISQIFFYYGFFVVVRYCCLYVVFHLRFFI
jgi:hypothetical protein